MYASCYNRSKLRAAPASPQVRSHGGGAEDIAQPLAIVRYLGRTYGAYRGGAALLARVDAAADGAVGRARAARRARPVDAAGRARTSRRAAMRTLNKLSAPPVFRCLYYSRHAIIYNYIIRGNKKF
jgi:hypothetical protein